MPLQMGNQTPTGLYLGTNAISRMYQGTALAWPSVRTFAEITDNFDDGVIGPVWSGSSPDVTESGGRAVIPCAGGYPNLGTARDYTIVNSSIYAKITPPLAAGATVQDVNADMGINSLTEGSRVVIMVERRLGVIRFHNQTGYWDGANVNIPYDPVAHAYWRIRETGGRIYMDTSPDAATWTSRHNFATPTWITSTPNLPIAFSSHRDSGDATGSFMYVDNVNLPPV